MLKTLREQTAEEKESTLICMVHTTDNLEAIVWQLYYAGFRPNIKYGAGRLSWVSLTVNNRTFINKSQQMIDWAIKGMMEVEDAGVSNRPQDANKKQMSSTTNSSGPSTGATRTPRTSRF